jgi:hypothetical protein
MLADEERHEAAHFPSRWEYVGPYNRMILARWRTAVKAGCGRKNRPKGWNVPFGNAYC